MKKKIISLVLALITLMGAIPSVVYAQVIEKYEDDNNWTIIKFQDEDTTGQEIYEGFKSNTDVTPSGSGLTKPFATDTVTLLEKSEIFTYMSYDWQVQKIGINDNIYVDESEYIDLIKGSDFSSFNADSVASVNDLCYATGVAFDPTGSGLKNHIAIFGYHNAGNVQQSAAYLYIFNGDTKALVATQEIDKGNFGWMYTGGKLDLDNVDAANLFQITAGDYNGDGKDSLVIYDGCATSNSAMYQYDMGASKPLTAFTLSSDKYLNSSWYKSTTWNRAYQSGKMNCHLNVCLESGDINGDGIDDLALVSCTGGLSKDDAGNNTEQTIATVSVGFGKKNTTTIAELTVSGGRIYDDSNQYTIAAPGLSIGDIDGDGENEVVVAGFVNKPSASKPSNIQNEKVAFTYYKASGTTVTQTNGLQILGKSAISPISYGDCVRRTDSFGEYMWQQFSVECVDFDGTGAKDYIFLNGYVYLLSSSGKPEKVSVMRSSSGQELFASATSKLYGKDDDQYDIDEVFILSAAVGNFTGSSTGAESLSLTVGFKVNQGKSKDADNNGYYLGEITITRSSSGSYNKGSLEGIYSDILPLACLNDLSYKTLTHEGVYIPSHKSDSETRYKGGFCGMSYIRVACDVGTDSVIGEYYDTEAFYSDPEVVAVLQAAPYFKELGAGNSSTVYSYSETYGKASGSGYEFALGVGLCAELESSSFKMEVEETVKSGISEEFENSIETTYTTEFEANDLNQVILRRKLYYNYYYKIKTYNGNLPDGMENKNDGIISITTLRNPSVTALTFQQYNAYAAEYNNEMAKNGKTARLNVISEEDLKYYHLSGNEGDPGSYASSLSAYGDKGFSMAKGDTWVELSNASGTITQQFEKAVGTAYTQETSTGVEVNIKVMAGASFAGNGAFAGVQASMEYFAKKSQTTSTVKTTTTSGTVQGIDPDMKDYAFQWQLIGWRASSDHPMFNKNVLFVGYLVNNVRSLPQPVSDLTESYSPDTDTVTLTWTSPTIGGNRPAITEFRVFQDGETVKYVQNKGEGETHTLTIDVSGNKTASSEFYILSRGSVNGSIQESIPSNAVTSIFAMTKKQTKALIQEMLGDIQSKTDALEVALAKKADSDQVTALTAAINDLTIAYKEADELLKKYVDEQDSALRQQLTDLTDAMNAADTSLQNTMAQVQADLEKAIAELKTADGENGEALSKAVTDLTRSYQAADALLKADMDNLSGQLEKLQISMDQVHQALQNAIEQVQSNLDKAIAELETADGENAEALSKAVIGLTRSYQAADALLNADMDELSGQLEKLQASLSQVHQVLQKATEQVQSNLDKAIAELKTATAEGDEENALACAEAIEAQKEAYQAADAILKKENSALRSELDTLKNTVTSLANRMDEKNAQYESEIEALTSVNQEQHETLSRLRTVATVGLVVSFLSLLGNFGLIGYSLARKKNLPQA